jgi:CRP-like cAMP-binding protein
VIPEATPLADGGILAELHRVGTAHSFTRNDTIFRQSAPADAVHYLVRGLVKLEAVSSQGKRAIISIQAPGAFLGEIALRQHSFRLATARAQTDVVAIRIPVPAMMGFLREGGPVSHLFMEYLLQRTARLQEDLLDRLFNPPEKRLARTLLLLAGQLGTSEAGEFLGRINQQTLAEIVGTTRPRISQFMTKFRRLGYITTAGGLRVNSSLLEVMLQD